jgi:hypothetical protein
MRLPNRDNDNDRVRFADLVTFMQRIDRAAFAADLKLLFHNPTDTASIVFEKWCHDDGFIDAIESLAMLDVFNAKAIDAAFTKWQHEFADVCEHGTVRNEPCSACNDSAFATALAADDDITDRAAAALRVFNAGSRNDDGCPVCGDAVSDYREHARSCTQLRQHVGPMIGGAR